MDKLLLEHVGLPYVLVLAVHLVNFFGLDKWSVWSFGGSQWCQWCQWSTALYCIVSLYVKYVVNYNCNTEHYGRSAVPFLQKLLNKDNEKQKKDLKCLLQVNNDIFIMSPSLRKIYTIITLSAPNLLPLLQD